MYFSYVNVFSILDYKLPLDMDMSFIFTEAFPFIQRLFVPIWIEVCPVVLQKKKINFGKVSQQFANHFLMGKDVVLLAEERLVPSWIYIGLFVLEKKIFQCCKTIFTISQASPFVDGSGITFEES